MATAKVAPTLGELAEIVSTRTKIIEDFLEKSKLPGPTFGVEHSQPDYLPSDNTDVLTARLELESAAQQLSDLAAGTKRTFMRHCIGPHNEEFMFHAMYAYDIPSHVPAHPGKISYEDLSEKCGLETDKLRRVLRFAMTMHYFYEPEPGHVAHTALSKLIVDEPEAADFLGLMKEEIFRASAFHVDAMRKWPGSNDSTQCGTVLAFGLDPGQGYWDMMSADAHRTKRFANAMKFARTRKGIYDPAVELASFDWQRLGASAKVVDVGGSIGHVSFAIARAAPNCRFVVQDLPSVIAQVVPADTPAQLADRVEFQAHDFFTPQPVKDADAYFLAHVLHDWPDDDCVKILRLIVAAMQKGSRLMLNDAVLPSAEVSPVTIQHKYKLATDLHMMSVLNARERALEDWVKLVQQGSEGRLKLEMVGEAIIVFQKVE